MAIDAYLLQLYHGRQSELRRVGDRVCALNLRTARAMQLYPAHDDHAHNGKCNLRMVAAIDRTLDRTFDQTDDFSANTRGNETG